MTWILLAVIGFIAAVVITIYNVLVRANIRAEESWSDVTVQLKRRSDLIPNLVKTVKGYVKQEESTFMEVTKARTATVKTSDVAATAEAENMLASALKSLFAVSEAYPELKADSNFRHLQRELADTEDKIQAARHFYNAAVSELNTKIQTFPILLFAGLFGFKTRKFFELDETESASAVKPVDVKLDVRKD